MGLFHRTDNGFGRFRPARQLEQKHVPGILAVVALDRPVGPRQPHRARWAAIKPNHGVRGDGFLDG